MVAINSIGQQAFHQLLSVGAAPEFSVGVEIEWFADREENVIGVVGFGGQYRSWGYALLKRDTPIGFRLLVRQEHFFTRHTASPHIA